MNSTMIEGSLLSRAALALFDEAYSGPAAASGTWFVDNEPDCGFLGSLAKMDAVAASRPLRPGDPATLASHAGHLHFALSLANRAAKGENPYPTAKWSESWAVHEVDGPAWSELVSELRGQYHAFREAIASGLLWKDEDTLTGTLGQIAHGAWHLGAIRQGLGLIETPKA